MSVERKSGDFLPLIDRYLTCNCIMGIDEGMSFTAEAAAQMNEERNGVRNGGTPMGQVIGKEGSRLKAQGS